MKGTASKRSFPLVPLHQMTWGFPVALWIVLLLLAFLGGTHQQSPDNPVPWWVVITFATALLPASLLSMLAHREIHLERDTLVLAAALIFARKVPVRDLALDRARLLDLDERTELKPMLQLWGFGLPGFKAGHYLLRNRSRAFCLLSARRNVLLLPLLDGKTQLLLSLERPQDLLDALRAP